jgi:hypothetical protein
MPLAPETMLGATPCGDLTKHLWAWIGMGLLVP